MNKFLITLISLSVIGLDQWTKYLAKTGLPLHVPHPIIPDFFNLTLVMNSGAAFGIFSRTPEPWRHIFLYGVSIVAVFVLIGIYNGSPKKDFIQKLALGFVLGGAIGNLIDRLRFDSVVDFLDFSLMGYAWPTFNIADSAITCGITIFLIRSMLSEKKANGAPLEAPQNS
jgi:signal peptidase II